MQKITQTEVKTVFSADNSQLTKTVTETEKTIEKLGNTADKSGGVFGKFGQDVKEGIALGFGVSTVGMITTAIGMIKDGIGTMMETGMEYEATMSKVQAITNATGSEMEQMGELAKKLGAETSKSASESAEAMTYMGMAGWDTQQILAGLPGVLNLAIASGEDFARVSDIVTDNLTAFGMEAEDASYYADVLAYSASNANVSVDSLGESLKYVAPVATGAGVSMEETVAMISLLGDAGIKGSQAGTTLRSVILNLTGANEKATAKLKELGVKIYDNNGKMRSMTDILGDLSEKLVDAEGNVDTTTATMLVGKTAVSGFTALLQTGSERLGSFTEALKTSDGTADRMAKTMQDNVKGSLEELGGALETVGLKIYDSIEEPLKAGIDAVTDFIEKVAGVKEVEPTFTIFGEKVSEGTHTALKGVEELSNGIRNQIGTLELIGGTVTPNFVNQMLTNYTGLKEGIVSTVDTMHDEELDIMMEYGKTALGYTDEQLNQMHQRMDKYRADKIAKVTELETEYTNILKTYQEGNKVMTEEHKNRLLEIEKELTQESINIMLSEAEEKKGLLKSYADDSFVITKENSASILRNALDHKNSMVSIAQKNLDEQLMVFSNWRKIGEITDEEYNKMVAEAQKDYDELVKESETSFDDIVRKIQEKLGIDGVKEAKKAGEDVYEAFMESHQKTLDDVAEKKINPVFDPSEALKDASDMMSKLGKMLKKTFTVKATYEKTTIHRNVYKDVGKPAMDVMNRQIIPTRNMYAESGVRNTNNNTINYNGNYNFRSKQDIDYFMKQTARLVDRKY